MCGTRNQRPKDYRLRDGDGLFLLVAKTGGKSFQFRYKVNGKGQTETLKHVDTLAAARGEAERLRKILAAGDDPKVVRRVVRATKAAANAQTFAVIAASWVNSESRRKKWSADYVDEVEQSLRNHLHKLDDLPVSTIIASITAPILHTVELAAPDMAEKVARRLDSIMDHAVEVGALERNPLPRRKPVKRERQHFAAITTTKGIGKLLRDARAADPCKGIARAHLLLAFCVQRISETVGATWREFDLKAGLWSIPRSRMKRKDKARGPHEVPIPPKLLACADAISRRHHGQLVAGRGDPSRRDHHSDDEPRHHYPDVRFVESIYGHRDDGRYRDARGHHRNDAEGEGSRSGDEREESLDSRADDGGTDAGRAGSVRRDASTAHERCNERRRWTLGSSRATARECRSAS